MILLGFRRKLTALALCKSIESAIQWFQIHHRITFAIIRNPAVYLSGARVSIFSTLVPRLEGWFRRKQYQLIGSSFGTTSTLISSCNIQLLTYVEVDMECY